MSWESVREDKDCPFSFLAPSFSSILLLLLDSWFDLYVGGIGLSCFLLQNEASKATIKGCRVVIWGTPACVNSNHAGGVTEIRTKNIIDTWVLLFYQKNV